jgi:hypothetical protein
VKGPRVLLWDIETTHNIVATFQLYGEDYIPHGNLLQERYIVCACWKWLGEKRIYSVSTLDDPKRFKRNPHDDRHVVSTLHGLMSSADAIVAHNGDQYDTRFLRGRAIAAGLPPFAPVRTIDTKKIAKRHFLFNSNRLDYLGKLLGLDGKLHTEPGLWLRVLKGDAEAIRSMVRYNKRDVELLEQIFLRLRPYMPDYLNAELFGGEGCHQCGGTQFRSNGFRYTATCAYRRLQCVDCGAWSKELKAAKKATKTRGV